MSCGQDVVWDTTQLATVSVDASPSRILLQADKVFQIYSKYCWMLTVDGGAKFQAQFKLRSQVSINLKTGPTISFKCFCPVQQKFSFARIQSEKRLTFTGKKSSILTFWAKMGKVTRWKGPIHLQALAPPTTLKLLSVDGRGEKGYSQPYLLKIPHFGSGSLPPLQMSRKAAKDSDQLGALSHSSC